MKKLLIPICTLLIGFILGLCYNFIFANKVEAPILEKATEQLKFEDDDKSIKPLVSGPIDRDTAMARIKDFQTINEGAGASAVMSENGFLQGFFIDAGTLTSIVTDKANYDGISFYIGKKPNHPGTKDKVLTLYFGGSKLNPKGIVGGTVASGNTQYTSPGTIYEYIDPCPTHCSDLGK